MELLENFKILQKICRPILTIKAWLTGANIFCELMNSYSHLNDIWRDFEFFFIVNFGKMMKNMPNLSIS